MPNINELKEHCAFLVEDKKKSNKKEAEVYKKAYNELLKRVYDKENSGDIASLFKI